MLAGFAAALTTLIAIIPGFVLTGVYRRQRRGPDPSEARMLALSLVASLPPHLVVAPWSRRLLPRLMQGATFLGSWEIVAWVLVLTLITPTILGLLLSYFVEASWMQGAFARIGWTRAARTQTAWDWNTQVALPNWIIVTLKDGRLVGGRFGRGSFVSVGNAPRDLFIAEPFYVNGDRTFAGPVAFTHGLWVDGTEISTVEFYEGSDADGG